jgi:transcriptional regulator with XRE-family HTH domain
MVNSLRPPSRANHPFFGAPREPNLPTQSASNLGQRLRELRTRNRWRISDVSEMTGLATSTISKVENGRMSLTYDKLQQLANGLSLDLAELFADHKRPENPGVATARRSMGRAGEGVALTAGSYQWRFLNADLAPKQMVPIIGLATARSLEEFGELIRHEGEEFLLVLEGAITVHTEFYAPTTLETGDHMYIDSRMGHAYLAAADGKCRVLVICTGAEAEDFQRVIEHRPAEQMPRPNHTKLKRAADGKSSERRARVAKIRK